MFVLRADYDISSTPGGVSTNALDMAKWMNFHLSGGEAPDGSQLVDSSLLRVIIYVLLIVGVIGSSVHDHIIPPQCYNTGHNVHTVNMYGSYNSYG